MKEVNAIKNEIQQQAHHIWGAAGKKGTVAAGTGFGKSRIAIMEVMNMCQDETLGKNEILLVTPTEKLRDENWPNEFSDWEASEEFKYVKAICYASLKNEKNNHYKLVILDEVHRLTDLAAEAFKTNQPDALTTFFAENLADAVLGLTATVPDAKRDPEKSRIITQIAPVVFTYSLDQGVADGMIADYEIRIIETQLDNTKKTIAAGTKTKPFMTTEAGQYEYLEKNIRKNRALAYNSSSSKAKASFDRLAMFATMARNRFLYNLPSKTELAAKCIKQFSAGRRTLVFAGSINQCNQLLGDNVYHSKSGSEAFDKFNAGEIDMLGVVNAANEGINFSHLDQALIIQVDSNERNLVQRVGRCLRLRDGHKAIIYIICVQNTADERWLEKSLKGFDANKVVYYSSKSIPV